jgi:hypothetical protein
MATIEELRPVEDEAKQLVRTRTPELYEALEFVRAQSDGRINAVFAIDHDFSRDSMTTVRVEFDRDPFPEHSDVYLVLTFPRTDQQQPAYVDFRPNNDYMDPAVGKSAEIRKRYSAETAERITEALYTKVHSLGLAARNAGSTSAAPPDQKPG